MKKTSIITVIALCTAVFSLFALSCTSFPTARTSVEVVILEKLNPQCTFILSPVRAQGASFGPRFGEQAIAQVGTRLRQLGLTVLDTKPASPDDFSYDVRLTIYEYDYIKKLETWYAVQLCFDIYDNSGNLAASFLCYSDSTLSASHAMYLDRLITLIVRELSRALSSRR